MNENQQKQTKEMNWTEDIGGKTGRVWEQTQDLVRRSNERQVVIRRGNHLQLMAFPLVFGVIGVLILLWLLPKTLAVAAIAAMIAGITLDIERTRPRQRSDIEDIDYSHKE
ncbi:MAG: DUF4342 domain-containing protein [Chloroflexota bacterium]